MKDLLENIGMTYKSPYPRFVAIPHVKPASDMLLSVDRNSTGSTVDYATRDSQRRDWLNPNVIEPV